MNIILWQPSDCPKPTESETAKAATATAAYVAGAILTLSEFHNCFDSHQGVASQLRTSFSLYDCGCSLG